MKIYALGFLLALTPTVLGIRCNRCTYIADTHSTGGVLSNMLQEFEDSSFNDPNCGSEPDSDPGDIFCWDWRYQCTTARVSMDIRMATLEGEEYGKIGTYVRRGCFPIQDVPGCTDDSDLLRRPWADILVVRSGVFGYGGVHLEQVSGKTCFCDDGDDCNNESI